MLALESILKTRLQALPALTAWVVRGGTDLVDRRPLPAAEIACEGAAVTGSQASGAKVEPSWTVTLVVRRSDEAAGQLDTAFAAVIGSLHNFTPAQVSGHYWSALALKRVEAPQFGDEGVAGIAMTFSTGAAYLASRA